MGLRRGNFLTSAGNALSEGNRELTEVVERNPRRYAHVEGLNMGLQGDVKEVCGSLPEIGGEPPTLIPKGDDEPLGA